MSVIARANLRATAALSGLFVTYYNAGNNPQWKVATVDKDYHALAGHETLGRFTTPREVAVFLDGFAKGLTTTAEDDVIALVPEPRTNTVAALVDILNTMPEGSTFRPRDRYVMFYDADGMSVGGVEVTPEGELIFDAMM